VLEEKEGPETGPDGIGAGANSAAMALALGSASRSRADRFLEEQTALVGDQRHHLREQLLPGIIEKWTGVFLRIATACVGLAFAGGVAWMVWEAKRSDGLKVEPFSVPPALAEHGVTGQVVAARVIDRLSELQAQTNTGRPARSYTNAWGDNAIKLEIPETGVSLEELDSWLRAKLGHETSLSGEVVRTQTGITLTARTTDGAVSVSGAEADLDALTGKLAEAIYRLTQPYRYGMYLERHEDRPADALPIFRELSLNGSPEDRLWSVSMWAETAGRVAQNIEVALAMYARAVADDPDALGAYSNMGNAQWRLGLTEDSARTYQQWSVHLRDGKQRYIPPDRIEVTDKVVLGDLNMTIGAFHDAALTNAQMLRTGVPGYPTASITARLIRSQVGEHDVTGARATHADPRALASFGDTSTWLVAAEAQDWHTLLRLKGVMAENLAKTPQNRRAIIAFSAPRLAIAQARTGDFTAAEATLAPTRGDCYSCLIARAELAEMQGQRARADYWFTNATEAGPSLPFAFEAEGRALLERNQSDQAIARFTIANQKVPHFADPLEGWGEALMAKNQSHLALAKFAEAEKYAPNWGRLHLKWGEALVYAGNTDEAKKQFGIAAGLDLTPSEKFELARNK
jgi:tetratricopeptide (TPR) repeat protein